MRVDVESPAPPTDSSQPNKIAATQTARAALRGWELITRPNGSAIALRCEHAIPLASSVAVEQFLQQIEREAQ